MTGIKFNESKLYVLDPISKVLSNYQQNKMMPAIDYLVMSLRDNKNVVTINGEYVLVRINLYSKILKRYDSLYSERLNPYKILRHFRNLKKINFLKFVKDSTRRWVCYINPRYFFKGDFISIGLIGIFNEEEWFESRDIEGGTAVWKIYLYGLLVY